MSWLQIVKILRSLVALRGVEKGRRVIGAIALLVSILSIVVSGDNISMEAVTKSSELLVLGGYGLIQIITGIFDRKKGKTE